MIENNDDIRSRTISGSFYSILASIVTIVLGIIRFVLLLDALSPGDFGIYTQALFFVALAGIISLPGLSTAYIQRRVVNETDTRTYFTLNMAFSLIAILLMMILAQKVVGPAYPDMPKLAIILIALLGIQLISVLNTVQETILRRSLSFRPVAYANVVSSLAMTIMAPTFAYLGYGAWSLVIESLSGQIARAIIFWGPFSQTWWPRLGWERKAGRWFLGFSFKIWGVVVLNFIVDRFDDFWIGRKLGQQDLGYYSRAYEAAHYPRRVVANPLLMVLLSTFSRLQTERKQLSQAFFRAMSLMVRTSFWFSLVFILAGPELIAVLGEKWLPMLATFQLMIIYTLLDPLVIGAAQLLVAAGQPELTVRTRAIQAIIFIPAVILLGSSFGIEGVAIAANLMMFVGAVIIFRLTHRFVDYSDRKLWLWPVVGLVAAGTAVLLLNPLWDTVNVWLAFTGKSILITLLFGGVLWLFERNELISGGKIIWDALYPHLKKICKGS